MNSLPFDSLPDFSRLFVDFVHAYDKVRPFFHVDRLDAGPVRQHLHTVADRYSYRERLVQALARQNRALGNHGAALEGIAKLGSRNTVAVVTGQQMGLFGGPLFTAIKALATIKWCHQYKSLFPDYDFVPVFWMELEDHDFQEVNRAVVLSVENELVDVATDDHDAENRMRRPVGRIVLGDGTRRAIDRVRNVLQPTGFTDPLMSLLENTYSSGETMGSGFGRLMASWFGHRGLILCDPSDPELKQLAAPIFKRELDDPETSHRLVTAQSQRLSAVGYHIQADAQPSNLFLLSDENSPSDMRHSEKVRITLDTALKHKAWLTELIENEPHRFIPNVILRPLVQDHILPTVSYVGGPAEIAYWAQLAELYSQFGVLQPVVTARPFVTILEKKNKKVLDKFGLTVPDMFRDSESTIGEFVRRNSSIDIEALFGEWIGVHEHKANMVEIEIARLDASLKGAVETAQEKIRHAISVLKDKTVAAEKRSQSQTVGQISKAFHNLYPRSTYQERLLSSMHFINKYDTALWDRLYEAVDLQAPGMQVIEI